MGLDVLEDTMVNTVNEGIRPQSPVESGEDVQFIPCRSNKASPIVVQGDQQEFPPLDSEIAVQVGWMDVAVRAQFPHGLW